MPKYIKMQQNRLLGLFGEERAIFKPITLKNITNGVIKIKGVNVWPNPWTWPDLMGLG